MNIQNRQQFLIVLTVAVLALYFGDLLVFEPMVKWWKSREEKVVALRQQVNEGKTLIRREQIIRGEWADMRTNALPNDSSLAEQQVLKSLADWAGDAGVNVSSETPQWQPDQGSENDPDNYSTLDCRVEASGDISTLSRFIYEIENDPMPLQLSSVELTASDDRGQQLTLGLDISGLSLISPQP